MVNDDTIKLLKECNAGVKTAVTSIDEVLDRVKNPELLAFLEAVKKEHEVIGDKTHQKLNEYKDSEKEPNPMAKAMSWLKINTKLMLEPTDQEVAELMIDGCNMGIKSVSRYMNQYPAASQEVEGYANELVRLEQRFMDGLRKYL